MIHKRSNPVFSADNGPQLHQGSADIQDLAQGPRDINSHVHAGRASAISWPFIGQLLVGSITSRPHVQYRSRCQEAALYRPRNFRHGLILKLAPQAKGASVAECRCSCTPSLRVIYKRVEVARRNAPGQVSVSTRKGSAEDPPYVSPLEG